jgi:hypothetical protein
LRYSQRLCPFSVKLSVRSGIIGAWAASAQGVEGKEGEPRSPRSSVVGNV